MGFIKWMASKGAVGGTARWAAKGYKFFRQQHPDEEEYPDPVIYRLMIASRYEAKPDPRVEQFLLTLSDSLKGLSALVVAILDQEAGFTENAGQMQQMFLDVIDEELRKQGLTPRVINGES